MTTTTIYNGTIRKRSDGRWEYAYKDTEGKRCFISAQSKAELHNRLDLAFAVPDPVTPPPEVTPPPQLLIKDWMPLWFSNYVTAGKSTRQRYEIDIRLHIIPSIGEIDVAELTSLQLQQMFKQLLSKGLSPKSVKNIHGVMHSALAIAVKLGYTPRNVTEDCSLPKVQKKEMKTLADAKLTTFLEAVQSDEFYEAFFVCIFTGVRESELLGLTWDCIDMEHGIIRIYRQFRRQNYHNEPSE